MTAAALPSEMTALVDGENTSSVKLSVGSSDGPELTVTATFRVRPVALSKVRMVFGTAV